MANQLSKGQTERLQTWLAAKWGPRGCARCGGRKWEVHTYVTHEVLPNPTRPTDMVALAQSFAASVLPCAGAVCLGCGDVGYISLIAAGVLDSNLRPIAQPGEPGEDVVMEQGADGQMRRVIPKGQSWRGGNLVVEVLPAQPAPLRAVPPADGPPAPAEPRMDA